VVVPTRTVERAAEFRESAGAADRLHLVVHDYTSFAGAEELAAEMEDRLGGVDDVVAPIGGSWAGKPLWEISESDWRNAFTGLASTHMAVLRAALPRMTADGAYIVIVGDSATTPVPGSGLVSMEQAAVLMMQRVAQAETGDSRRIFALMLGPVGTGITPTRSGRWPWPPRARGRPAAG
jgi:NAD(P)-dependent dehydrogenase (short-subunit alcohol dehydrogenase family)